MHNWSELPNEILNVIFLYLKLEGDARVTKQEYLAQCTLTCCSWKVPAQAIYFSEIHLRSVGEIQKIYEVASINEKIGKSVKILTCIAECHFNVITLFAIDILFPNLEKIEFGRSDISYTSFCEILFKSGKFDKLKAIPNSMNITQDKMYLQCLDFLKDRVSSIEFVDDNNNNRNLLYIYLRDKFGNYPRLKKITINIPYSNNTVVNGMQYIKEVMKSNNITLLQELAVKKSSSMYDSSHNLRLLTKGGETLLPTNSLKNLYVILPRGNDFDIGEEFMLFIMNNFTHLNNFRLEGDMRHFYMSQSFDTTLLDFMKYLYAIPNFLIENYMTTTENAAKILEKLYTTMEKDPASSLSRSFDLSVTKQSYYERFEKGRTCLRLENINFLKMQNLLAITFCNSELAFIQRIGRFFHKISIQAISPNNLAVLLDSIENHCIQLEHLVITGWGSKFEESIKRINDERSKTIVNNIKKLVLKQFALSPAQLQSIIARTPNLESLILSHCFLYTPFIGDTLILVCLLNASLKYLEIDLDDKTFSEVTAEKIYYIKLATDTSQKPKYCSFLAECDSKDKITGYNLAEKPTAAAFDESITDNKVLTCFIYCKSVKKFTIKYIEAASGHHKEINLFPMMP